MSSLIFFSDKTQVLVATDTLVVEPENGYPINFASKAFYLSHLKTIICATGLATFYSYWVTSVNSDLVANSIDELATSSQDKLIELWEWYQVQYPGYEDKTTTIYHFGYSSVDEKMKGYAHRSTNDFIAEPIIYGTGTKPECELPTGQYELVKIIPDLMKKQIVDQEALPKEDRVYIGGEINAIYLTKDRCNCFKIGEFETYQEDKLKIEGI